MLFSFVSVRVYFLTEVETGNCNQKRDLFIRNKSTSNCRTCSLVYKITMRIDIVIEYS